MAIIRKAITGLKPGTDYLFSLKPKNVELSASDSELETLRVAIPEYTEAASAITGLQVSSNFETVIINFNAVSDIDLDYYEYQIYDNEVGSGSPLNPRLSSSNDSSTLVSGFNKANVFVVSLQNSSQSINPVNQVVTTVNKTYWVRVRAVNTSGNPSTSWTSLVSSGQLNLIQDQYISTLTAAKITAGTIGAHTITLNGANSIIKSSIYSATQGWQIDGQGNATFNTATLRGEFSSGTSPNWFRVDTSGNIWSGASTYSAAASKFRVSNAGSLTAALGTIGGWTISSSAITSSGGNVILSNTGDFTIGSNVNDRATITSTGDFFVTGTDANPAGVGAGNSRFYGPWFNVKKGHLSDAAQPNAQLTYRDLIFFGSDNSSPVIISGGNDGGTGYISVNGSVTAGTYLSAGTTITAGTVINAKQYYCSPTAVAGQSQGLRIDRYYYWAAIDHPGYGWPYEDFIQFVNADSNQETGAIVISGGGVAYNSSSDRRMKENIKELTNGIDIVKKMKPVEYNFKNFEKVQHGLIAQDLQLAYGHAVTVGDNNEDEIEKPWSIDYGKLTPILITAVKELINKVEQLESNLV